LKKAQPEADQPSAQTGIGKKKNIKEKEA